MDSLHNGPTAAVKPQPRLIDGVKLQLKLPTLSATFRALLGTSCSPARWQSRTTRRDNRRWSPKARWR